MYFDKEKQAILDLSNELGYGIDSEELEQLIQPLNAIIIREERDIESISLGYEVSEEGILSSIYEPEDLDNE